MLEKTMKVKLSSMLLRSFFAVVMVCSLLFASISPITANAAEGEYLDYADLDYSVKYGDGINTVTYEIPEEWFLFWYDDYQTGKSYAVFGKDTLELAIEDGDNFNVAVYPATNLGFKLDNMPVGTRLYIEVALDQSDIGSASSGYWQVWERSRYLDSSNTYLNITKTEATGTDLNGDVHTYALDFVIEDVAGAVSFVPSILFENFTGNDSGVLRLQIVSAYVEMDVSTEFWSQFQDQQNGKMLGAIKDELSGVNDKLDDTNEKLDALPEDIGNEMQGVIDSENEKAESSGNKFVNQILDALPDPSTEVLSSLKSLTDAMAYTGTDAKLKIPALVIPAVGGLFPETEIWGGTEFSFSDYLTFLPSALLTVVQSLFTIAIVLFCVYELKGIISYCLTLNDKKGG